MKHTYQIPKSICSVLLAVILLLGSLSAGFTAFAAEDTYQVLADALRADGMQSAVAAYTFSTSPDVKNTLIAADPKAASAAYSNSIAMWAAMDAYWIVAKSVRSTEKGNIIVGDNGNVYDGWTGENNTARKISRTVLKKLVSDGYMTLDEVSLFNVIEKLDWFAGNFTAEYALLDEPLRSEKPSLLPWTHQVFGSIGYFGVSRTRDEALYDGTRNIEQIPATLVLNRRWSWEHGAKYAQNGTNRQFWHELAAMKVEENVDVPGLQFDAAQADTAELKATLKNWRNLFTQQFFKQDLSGSDTQALDELADRIDSMLAAAKALYITNSLLYFYGLPTYVDVDVFVRKIACHKAIAPYRAYTEFFDSPMSEKQLGKLSQKDLQAEILTARTNYEALVQVSRTDLTVYEGLIEENGLNMAAAEVYLGAVLLAMTTTDANDLVAVIAAAIQGQAPYPAMTYNSLYQTYSFSSAGLSFNQVLDLYEKVVSADAALTGSIDGVANFPGYNVAARLSSAHGIAVANAPSKAIAAIRASLQGLNPRLMADYSTVPAGSGWTGDLNYEPAPAEWAALLGVGGPPKADPGHPPYERIPSLPIPAPEEIPGFPGTFISAPDFTTYPRATIASLEPLNTDPAWATWEFTRLIYLWIDNYTSVDYPLVPNTAPSPADNSSRQNDEYPITGTDQQKYAYLVQLNERYTYEMFYLSAQDEALRYPENAYKWLQTKWKAYMDTPTEASRQEFISAAGKYYARLGQNSDGTYVNNVVDVNGTDYPIYVQDGVNALILEYRDVQQRIDIITIYSPFFNAYRLSMQPGDYGRYSNANLKAELAAVEARLRQFTRDYPGETVPTEFQDYLATVREAIRERVFDEIDSLSGDPKDIAKQYDRNTLLPKTGAPYSYNLNSLELWVLVKGLFTLTPQEQAQLTLAQQVLAYLKGLLVDYETLHWELIAGQNDNYFDDWLPVRGLDQPIALRVGLDEFHVKYEHIENMINKLDTLLTSEYFKDNYELFKPVSLPEGKLITGSGAQNTSGLPNPMFNLPPFDSEFLARLGQMRTSSGELVITDPRSNISITLPPLDTMRNPVRTADEATAALAERKWIQAYRADVLMYLLHWLFEAVNTGETSGLQMLSWILYQVMPPSHSVTIEFWDTDGNLIDRTPHTLQVVDGMTFDTPVELMDPFTVRKVINEDDDFIDYEIADYTYSYSSYGGEKIYSDAFIALYFTVSYTYESLEKPAVEEAVAAVSEAVPQAINTAFNDLNLSAAVKPLFTEILTGLTNQNLLNDTLPATILGLYKLIADQMAPVLDGPLLKRPANPGGPGLLEDIRFASFYRLDLTLGFVLEQIAGKSRYTITVNDLVTLPEFQSMFNFGTSNLLELLIGAEITPNDLVEKCWPDAWPKADGIVPPGAPSYVAKIAGNLAGIYGFLNTPGNFASGQNDNLGAWQNLTEEALLLRFKFGLENIEDYTEKREAFEDIMTFSMSGLSFLMVAVFTDTPLEMSMMTNGGATYINTGELAPQSQTDYWYNDLIVGLAGVTRGINDIIQGALGVFNSLLSLIGLPPINFPPILLDDVRVSRYIGDQMYTDNRGEMHWRGRYDSRVGLESSLTAVNAYGRIFVPLFELLGIDPLLFRYSEEKLNQVMADLVPSMEGTILGLNSADKTAARATIFAISRALTQSLIDPLLNWLAPLDDDLIQHSLGFRPVGKVLDLLPNLAFVTGNGMIPGLVNDVLDGLVLDVTLYIGGLSGSPLEGLVTTLADYLQYDLFDVNFFLELFVFALPDLLNAGPLMERILSAVGMGMAFIFAVPMVEIVSLPSGSFAGMFRNRNDGNGTTEAQWPGGNEDYHLTILEGKGPVNPSDGVREGCLGSIVGFFGGDSAANSMNFKLFGENGLQLGKMITGGITNGSQPQNLLGYFKKMTGIDLSSNLDTLVNSVVSLFLETDLQASAPVLSEKHEQNEKLLAAIDKAVSNESHLEGLLFELFNPQTYPCRDFMNYALLDIAKSKNPRLNEVNYSDVWNRTKAQYFADHLMLFLDNLCDFLIAEPFLTWFYDMLEEKLGFDLRQPYTAKNLDALLCMVSDACGGFLRDLKLEERLDANSKLGILLRQTQRNIDIDAVVETVNCLIDYENAVALRARVAAIPDSQDAFMDVIYELLLPLAPLLKLFLTGGRTTDAKGNLIETIWEGELYPNNGAKDIGWYTPGNFDPTDPFNYVYNMKRYIALDETADNYTSGKILGNNKAKVNDPDGTFYTIGAEGDNLTFLEDFLGFSGYDGYRQALIPIYEHLGVPKQDIPTFQQFVLRATDPVDGDMNFFRILLTPILNLYDNIIKDPINELVNMIPNLVYFLGAEGGNENMPADGTQNNFVECVNRLLRPVYAILDMTAPLVSVQEAFYLLGKDYPGQINACGTIQPLGLPLTVSLNTIATGFLRNLFADASDSVGLSLSIALTDITDLITGTLVIYKSQSGQDDAVRLDANLPDLLTNLMRKIIELLFTEENYAEVRVFIAARVQDNQRDFILPLCDNLADLMMDHTLKGHIGADLIMSMLFYMFLDSNSLTDDLLLQRNTYSARIASFFELVASSSSPWARRYAERARRFLNLLYGDIMTPDNGVQRSGFNKFITDFWGKITGFFKGIGDWFMKLIRLIFPFFFR